MAQYQLRVWIEKVSQGDVSNQNAIKQVVGGAATITTARQALTAESPIETDIIVTDAQIVGLFGYLGLLNADINASAISTSAIETAIATVVAAN